MAVAEAWRDNAERRDKMFFCRPKIAFLRENLVRRVAPRSSQSSAPIFGCERRAPTSEGCHRWCPVHRDVGRDSREFLEQEKEVGSPASTHLGSVVRFSKRRALLFPRLYANTNHYIFADRANFASSSENALCREGLGPCANTAFGIGLESASEDNFVLRSWRIFAADFVVTL